MHCYRLQIKWDYKKNICPPIITKQRLSKNITAVTNTHSTIEEIFDASLSDRLIKDIRWFVLPRTCC
jgi:hypothetical protein